MGFKVGDTVESTDKYSQDVFEVRAIDGDILWLVSQREKSLGYSNPFYTWNASEVVKVEPKWEVGHVYARGGWGSLITVTAVDSQGNALVQDVDIEDDYTPFVGAKRAEERGDYEEQTA